MDIKFVLNLFFPAFVAENIHIQQAAAVAGGPAEACSCVCDATKAAGLGGEGG